MESTNIQSFLDLGLTGLLLVAVIVLAKYLRDALDKKDEIIKNKDDLLQNNRDQVISVVKENTKTQEQLRSVISEHITLTEKLYDALTRN